MQRTSIFANRAILVALIMSLSQLVFGQAEGIGTPGWITKNIRPGTEIPVNHLGDYLANKLAIGETEKNLPGQASGQHAAPRGWASSLRVDLVSRETGFMSSYSSESVDVTPNKTYGASTWLSNTQALNDRLAAPLKPAEFQKFRVQQSIIKGIGPQISPAFPDVCKDATHAVLVSLVAQDDKFSGSSGAGKTMALCLKGER